MLFFFLPVLPSFPQRNFEPGSPSNDDRQLHRPLGLVSYLYLGFYHKRKRKGPSVAGFEAPGPRGRVYILTGQKTVQLESPENLFLLRIEAREGALRAGPASRTKLFAALRGIVVRDFLDSFELLHQTGLRNCDSRLAHAAVQQGDQREGQNTGKGMDAEHVVGPMTGRGEANAVGIFHLSEGSLDVMLAAIAKDDLLVGEIGAIGEQNPLAQNTLLKFPVGFLIRSKGNPESLAFARDLAPKKTLDVLAGNNGVQILLNIRYRVGLAPPAGFMA